MLLFGDLAEGDVLGGEHWSPFSTGGGDCSLGGQK
jgi:hypothetical protein